jgi:hypothetical protein
MSLTQKLKILRSKPTLIKVFLSYGNFSDFEGFKKSTETVTKPRELPNVLNMKGEL